MKRNQFTLILCLVLTTAFMLTACWGQAPSDQSAGTAGTDGTQAVSEPDEAGKAGTADAAEANETAGTAGTDGTQTVSEQDEAGKADTADTAAGAAALSSDPCPSISAEEYPRVDGSTATLPLSYALYQAAVGVDEEAAMEAISHNKTDNSYRLLVNGDCDLVLAYEPSEETREYVEENGNVDMKPIGRDALVFMVNASNPVKSLTEEQIQSVYSGKISNWKELGGNDEEIVAFQRKQNSGSQTLMEKLVMGDIPMAEAPAHYYISSMGELLDQVSSYNNQGNAIGYSVYFYARNMYSVPGLEFLSVDSVTPSNDTIQDGSYPYVNEFYAVIRGDEPKDSPARLLFEWLTSEGGQKLVADTGYVPVLEKQSAGGDTAPALVMAEKGDTSYDLKEDQVILMDGNSWFNSPAVQIMNADMTERGLLEGYSLTQNKSVMVWSINEPLILMDSSSGKRGLYDLAGSKWILEPEYQFGFRNASEDYVFSDPGENKKTIYNGSDTLQIEDEFLSAGDYYWIKDDTGYSIRKDGKEISGHVDVPDPEQSDIRTVSYDYNVAVDPGTNQDYLYTADGELLFKPDYLQPQFENWQDISYTITTCTNAGGLLRICIRGEDTTEFWIYDLETGDFFWPGDEDVNIILRNKKGDYAFQTKGEHGLTILTDSLEPLKSPDGTPYEYCFGMDCYGYRDTESGNLVVENPDGSVHFEMPYHDEEPYDKQGTMIAEGVILYTKSDWSLSELTSYGEPLCSSETFSMTSISESPGDYTSINQDYTALYMGDNLLIFETDTGKLTYQTSEIRLMEKDYPVMVFKSGNYLDFRDPNGSLVLKVFADQYGGE